MIKIPYTLWTYTCDVCNRPVKFSKYDIYCGICGKKLCKNCAKRGICAECYFELSEKYLKIIKRTLRINKSEFFIAITPIISVILLIIIPIISFVFHLGLTGTLFYQFLIYYGIIGIFPGICFLSNVKGKKYSKIPGKIAKFSIPTFERFYIEFNSILEDEIKKNISKYMLYEKSKKRKEILINNIFVNKIIEKFVSEKTKEFPESKERIIKACRTCIKNKKEMLKFK